MADSGPVPRVSNDELLDVFRESDKPALIAKYVADEVPIGRRAVDNRLKTLVEQDDLEMGKVATFNVYTLPRDGSNNEQEQDESPEAEFSELSFKEQVRTYQQQQREAFELMREIDQLPRSVAVGVFYMLINEFDETVGIRIPSEKFEKLREQNPFLEIWMLALDDSNEESE